jgi:uncharacterized membrane protein
VSESRLDFKSINKPEPKSRNVNQAVLFILPSIVITLISIVLFARLSNFPQPQYNIFLVTIISAIVLSLIGMAGMQVLIYRIVDDSEHFSDGGAKRAIRLGLLYSFCVSLILIGIMSPYLLSTMHFSGTDFLYFAYLLFLYSATWIVISAFWASERYKYPAVIFTVSYIGIFAITYLSFLWNSAYTTAGYSIGVTLLFIITFFTAAKVFPKPRINYALSKDLARLPKLISQNTAPILFNIFYVLAIFLDKIIVWVSQGLQSGQGLVVTGTYTTGAFLGLVPMFSIAAAAYFSARTKQMVQDRYSGTLSEIQNRMTEYKRIYWLSLSAMLMIALLITLLTASISYYFLADVQMLQILITVAIGSIFFTGIVFNSTVLVVFGKSRISTFAVLLIILCELASMPFVQSNVWYAALAFAVGSFAGFTLSSVATLRVFSYSEFKMFRLLLKPQKI